MTKEKEQIHFIRERCIAANADIVALKMGCEVEREKWNEWDSGRWFVIAETAVCSRHKKFDWACFDGGADGRCEMEDAIEVLEDRQEDGFSMFTIKSSEIKVLGRPIRLADVLVAIRATNVASKYYSGITCLGNFTEDFNEKTVWRNEEKKPIHWDLRTDDLREQSEETINFLAELLK